jgi:hypothetical protein
MINGNILEHLTKKLMIEKIKESIVIFVMYSGILDKVNSLTNKTPLLYLFNTADSLISLATTEVLKYKIDIRNICLQIFNLKIYLS